MPARGDHRSAGAILKEIDAITMPAFDDSKRQDGAYIQRFIRRVPKAGGDGGR